MGVVNQMKKFADKASVIVFWLTGIPGVLLSEAYVYEVAGLIGVIIGVVLLPIVFFLAPFAAGFAEGYWTPFLVTYGGVAVSLVLFHIGNSGSRT